MNLKSWIVALTLATFGVVGGGYVYNRAQIEDELNSENFGISEEDMNVDLEDVEGFLSGVKNIAVKIKDTIVSIVQEYIDKD